MKLQPAEPHSPISPCLTNPATKISCPCNGIWKAPWLPSDLLPSGTELRASSQHVAGWRWCGGKLSLGKGSRSQAQGAAQHRTCKREWKSFKEALCGLNGGTACRATPGSHERVASPAGVLTRGVPRQVLHLGRYLVEHPSLMSFSYTEYKPFHESLPTPVREVKRGGGCWGNQKVLGK